MDIQRRMAGNPFNFGKPASEERFVGRWQQVEEMASALANPYEQSQLLVGGRRFGKSSFLETLQRSLVKRLAHTEPGEWYVFPVLVDLKSLGQSSRSPEGVFYLMLRNLYELFTSRTRRSKIGLAFEFDVSQTQLADFKQSKAATCTLEQFSDIIDDLVTTFLDAHDLLSLVFLLDEIDMICDKEWATSLFDNLRSLIYADKVRDYVRLVLAGSSQIVEVREQGSALLNVLNLVLLNAIDDDEIRKIIHFAGNVPEDFAEAVLEQCGGHPFLAQYIMHKAWDSLQTGTIPALSAIVNGFYKDPVNSLNQWCIDVGEVGLVAYRVLSEASDWLTQAQIEEAIQDKQLLPKVGPALYRLCYHGLALHDSSWERYRVTGRLFQDWFAENKLPYIKTPTKPLSAPDPPSGHARCKPVIRPELAPIYPTIYWNRMKKDRFPLITLVIDNSLHCCTNATLTIKAFIYDYSNPDSDTFDVPAGSIVRKPLLPRLKREIVLSHLKTGVTAPCNIVAELHTEQGTIRIYDTTVDIEMQSINNALLMMRNEQGILEDMADNLAVFVTPQRQEVRDFVGEATSFHPDKAFDGYQAGVVNAENEKTTRLVLRNQAQAFFDALIDEDLRYVPPSMVDNGIPGQIIQRIYFPFEVLPKTIDKVGQSSCLDIVILFASLLEHIGMEALIVLIRESAASPAHAFVGWHIWKGGNTKDFLDVNMISEGNVKFTEALNEGNRLYQEAIKNKLDERSLYDPQGFMRVIDLADCRKRNIRPFT